MWRFVHAMIVIGAVTLSLAEFQGVAVGSQSQQTVTFQIDGMTCGGCVNDVKAALAKVPGVSEVALRTGKKWIVFPDYADAHASVTFDPEKTDVKMLIIAVEAASNPLSKYKAQVVDK